MAYEVRTSAFTGPFDLLLQLILREKVELYDIPIARITDAYLEEIDRIERCDLEVATEFLLIAATLVEMKVRLLLPERAAVSLDDELEGISERDLLLARLVECGTFRAASGALRRLVDEARRSRPRRVGVNEDRWLRLMPDLLEGVTPTEVHVAYLRAATPAPVPHVDVAHITPISLTVGDAVTELVDKLTAAKRATFRLLTDGIHDRIGLVVRFLAVLELIKQGLADVEQATTFGEIVVLWTGDETVRPEAVVAGVDAYGG